MYVRVKSPISGLLYQSIVYGRVNEGWFQQYIVLNPEHSFELVDALDKTVSPAAPLVQVIQSDTEEFVTYEGTYLLRLKRFARQQGEPSWTVDRLDGYRDVCDNVEFLTELLHKKKVPAEKYPIQIRTLSDLETWQYISTQADADRFMQLFAGFHDSTLERLLYTEDSSGKQEAMAVFDNREWFGIAELCFEGVQLLKLCPPGADFDRYIYDASLFVQDGFVFWADAYMEQPDEAYSGSIIKALSLKWRKIDTIPQPQDA